MIESNHSPTTQNMGDLLHRGSLDYQCTLSWDLLSERAYRQRSLVQQWVQQLGQPWAYLLAQLLASVSRQLWLGQQ